MPTVLRVPDLRQQVYEGMKENIRLGRYPSDARFLEHSVAKEFGVSRTPAREALALLEQDGLIAQEGRSFRFPRVTLEEILETFEVRIRLEPFAIRLAVERSTDAQLRSTVAFMRRELKKHGSDDSYVQSNRRIRDLLFGLAKNGRMVTAIQSQEDYTQYIRTHTLNVAAIRAKSVSGMHALAEVIEKRDIAAAETAMEKLLLAAKEAIVDYLRGEPSTD